MPKTQMLDAQYAIEFDDESRWATIFVTEGPRLNFGPESVHRLRKLLNQKAIHVACGISETYIATLEDGWLRLIAYHRDDYDFSPATTKLLKSFLDDVLGLPLESSEV